MEWFLYDRIAQSCEDKGNLLENAETIDHHTLKPGDVLYIPRRIIHKSLVPAGNHCLMMDHI